MTRLQCDPQSPTQAGVTRRNWSESSGDLCAKLREERDTARHVPTISDHLRPASKSWQARLDTAPPFDHANGTPPLVENASPPQTTALASRKRRREFGASHPLPPPLRGTIRPLSRRVRAPRERGATVAS